MYKFFIGSILILTFTTAAYGQEVKEVEENCCCQPEVGLRDWFAGQAIIGIIGRDFRGPIIKAGNYARQAYKVADAMMKESESS